MKNFIFKTIGECKISPLKTETMNDNLLKEFLKADVSEEDLAETTTVYLELKDMKVNKECLYSVCTQNHVIELSIDERYKEYGTGHIKIESAYDEGDTFYWDNLAYFINLDERKKRSMINELIELKHNPTHAWLIVQAIELLVNTSKEEGKLYLREEDELSKTV